MSAQQPSRIDISFPGELSYLPHIRKMISDMLQVMQLNSKFVFRSELIIDELCTNAVCYGGAGKSQVNLICEVFDDRVEYTVKDHGGKGDDLQRLRSAIETKPATPVAANGKGMGLDLVRMLSEELSCSVENNMTRIHVIRRREAQ